MQDQIDTLIGEHTTITGDLRFSGGLHIDGKIEGSLICDAAEGGTLIISELARVTGEVKAPRIVVNGSVKGDLTATEKLEIQEKARVKGNVYYRSVEMRIGAQVNGQLCYQAEPGVVGGKADTGNPVASLPGKK